MRIGGEFEEHRANCEGANWALLRCVGDLFEVETLSQAAIHIVSIAT